MLISIKISRNSAFFRLREAENAIFLLINVKMSTIVDIFTFMSKENFMLTRVEHEKSFITSGLADLSQYCFVNAI